MIEKNLPAYYPTMYLDGYTPTEILFAPGSPRAEGIEPRAV